MVRALLIMMAAASFLTGIFRSLMTAALAASMLRMNIIARKTAYESRNETSSACVACVYIKTYDTETVPHHKHKSADSDKQIPHPNLQSYKFHSIFHENMVSDIKNQ